MLVLSRKVGERIWIGDQISVTVVRLTGGGVRLGIEAPPELPVIREELKLRGIRGGNRVGEHGGKHTGNDVSSDGATSDVDQSAASKLNAQ